MRVRPEEPAAEEAEGLAAAEAEGLAAAEAAEETLAALTAALEGGEDRPPQRVMARAVARSLASGRHLVVQAGTGTGKSLAYAVPAALSGQKVVVATATKALQDQLAGKDLPSVAAALDRPLHFAVLKGRANYLCWQRLVELTGGGFQPEMAPEPQTGAGVAGGAPGSAGAPAVSTGRLLEDLRRLIAWAEGSKTGDRAELEVEPHPRAWAMLSVGPRECPGAFRCPEGHRCFAERARAEAAAADIVVVNSHLYGAHLASGGTVLPEHDAVVFDEAHEVEDVMTASLGSEVSAGRLRALVALGRPLVGDQDSRIVEELSSLADQLEGFLGLRVGRRLLRSPAAEAAEAAETGGPSGTGAAGKAGGSTESTAWEDDEELSRLLERVTAVAGRLSEACQGEGEAQLWGSDGAELGPRRARALSSAAHLVGDIVRLARRSDDEVVWVDGTARAPVLRLSPIDVGPLLADLLWGQVTGVLTSATIPPGLGRRLGLDPERTELLDVGSPFDYRSQGLLYVARHLPDRRSERAEEAIHEELEALIGAAGGRTLALFTSRRASERAAGALREALPFPVLLQGELPKPRLLARFSAEESSCLFATMGFWQGVDVPGRSLSLVTLDRLPFGRPDDPLLEARRERAGEAAFRLVDLPRAAALLAQGAGRLIRAADDYGVVAVLDPRLATAGYRQVLLSALPPFRRTVDRRQVEAFLARAGAPDPDLEEAAAPGQ